MELFFAVLAGVIGTLIVSNFITGEKKLQQRVEPLYGAGEPPFVRSMGSLIGPALLPGNGVRTLVNGDEIFPAMLEAIRSAERTITFETFIYWSGSIGRELANALADRARAGVRVHVLLDWLGSKKMDEELLDVMTEAGIEVRKYHPLRWYNFHRLNKRTHRKLLVIDGRIGFTGGVGIADEWLGNAEDPDHWRDSHFRVEGPVVAQMQGAFTDNWLKTEAVLLHGDEYFPQLEEAGTLHCQMFKSSAGEGSESARLMFMLSIASARKTLRITNAYFVPDDLAVAELCAAAERGVDVRVIVPGKNIDTHVTRRASRSRWGKLLEAGVRIFEYQPTMLHAKVTVVDDIWSSVGSTNFDNRSFRLNDEANLNVLDSGFAARQNELFERDLTRSREVTFEEWRNRPWREKLLERAAGLLRSQL